jgi:hypothetical protein
MIIHWTPQADFPAAEFSQPEPDVLAIEHYTRDNDPRNDVAIELDFSNTTAVEYETPSEASPYVQRAWRENGQLHLQVVSHHHPENAMTTETVIDYGVQENMP